MKTTIFTTMLLATALFAGSVNGQTTKPQAKKTNDTIHQIKNPMEKQNYTATILVDKDPKTHSMPLKTFVAGGLKRLKEKRTNWAEFSSITIKTYTYAK
jgi:hypothetical protein